MTEEKLVLHMYTSHKKRQNGCKVRENSKKRFMFGEVFSGPIVVLLG
jgi:hypothetical protein